MITAADFTINAEAICTAEPGLYGVQLKDVRGGLNDLVAAKVPEQVRRLDLSSNAADGTGNVGAEKCAVVGTT